VTRNAPGASLPVQQQLSREERRVGRSTEKRGVTGYRLGAGGKLPPLVLDDDQAIAIALALQPALVTGIDDAVARALTTVPDPPPQ